MYKSVIIKSFIINVTAFKVNTFFCDSVTHFDFNLKKK